MGGSLGGFLESDRSLGPHYRIIAVVSVFQASNLTLVLEFAVLEFAQFRDLALWQTWGSMKSSMKSSVTCSYFGHQADLVRLSANSPRCVGRGLVSKETCKVLCAHKTTLSKVGTRFGLRGQAFLSAPVASEKARIFSGRPPC